MIRQPAADACLRSGRAEEPLVFFGGTVASQRHLNLPEQGRDRACGADARRRRRTDSGGRMPR